MTATREPILSVRGLEKHFPIKGGGLIKRTVGAVRAVDGLDLDLYPGEVLGLVGESGCGKATTGRAILNLQPATGGSVLFQGREIVGLGRKEMRPLRRDIQIVFQDPYASLNPRLPVFDIVAEPLIIHGLTKDEAELRERVRTLVETVGLNPEHTNRYPAEFSGGQRQRIGIARALALEPKVLVLDEPVSALDVSVQAQVLALFAEVRERFRLAMVFITHDLRVAGEMCDHIAVMQRGEIVEYGETAKVLADPRHAYTRTLIEAQPRLSAAARPEALAA